MAFLASDDPFARKYAEWTGKSCREDSINYECREVDRMELEVALHAANRDPTVHGIMIFYPVFGQEPSFDGGSMDDYLRDSIAPEKDVEGLCHTFRSNLYRNVRFMDEGAHGHTFCLKRARSLVLGCFTRCRLSSLERSLLSFVVRIADGF